MNIVAVLALQADVFVDASGSHYTVEAVFFEDGYFRAEKDGEEFEIEFNDVDLNSEKFMKLTDLVPADFQ